MTRYAIRMTLRSTGEVRESRPYSHRDLMAHLKLIECSPLFSSITTVERPYCGTPTQKRIISGAQLRKQKEARQ